MPRIARVGAVAVSLLSLAVACSKDPPPAQPPVTTATPPGGPPPVLPGQPRGPATAPPTTTAPPVAPGQMAVPGPTALSCQNDSQCLSHRCNTQYGKCAFPCLSDTDCIQGTTCLGSGTALAICVLKGVQ